MEAMVAVRSRPMLVAMLGLSLAGALPAAPAFASESAVDWLNRVSQSRRSSTDQAPWVAGEIVAVHPRGAKLTLAHEAIPAADMPAMTMTFPVAYTALLDQVRTGEAVDVQAANQGGVVRIVNIRPSR